MHRNLITYFMTYKYRHLQGNQKSSDIEFQVAYYLLLMLVNMPPQIVNCCCSGFPVSTSVQFKVAYCLQPLLVSIISYRIADLK